MKGQGDSRGKNPTGHVSSIEFGHGASAGRVFVGGTFTSLKPPRGRSGSPVGRTAVAALETASGSLLSWDPRVQRTVGTAEVTDMALSPDGTTLYIGGLFTAVGGQPRRNVAAVDAVTGAQKSWAPRVSAAAKAMEISSDGTRLYIGGHFSTINGLRREKLAGFDVSTGSLLAGWDPVIQQEPNQPCPPRCYPTVLGLALAPDGQTVYLGGSFAFVDGLSCNSVAAVRASDGVLLPWDPNVYQSGM